MKVKENKGHNKIKKTRSYIPIHSEHNIDESGLPRTQTELESDSGLRAMELSYEERVTEVERVRKGVMKAPRRVFDLSGINIRRACEKASKQVMFMKLTSYLDVDRYERFSRSCR